MSWGMYHGEQQYWSWDLEHPMQGPQAVFSREADIRNEEKVCWKVGELPEAEHSVHGDRLLVRPWPRFSPHWVFLHGTLLDFVETSWETDLAQRGTGISVMLNNYEGMVLQSQLQKNTHFSNLLHLPPLLRPFLLCNLTPKNHPPPLLQHVSKRHCSNNR